MAGMFDDLPNAEPSKIKATRSAKVAPMFDDLPDMPPPDGSVMQFDAMGNPTGLAGSDAPTPQMPYGEQMGNVAQGVGNVSKVLANGMTFGLADKGVAQLRAATGDAPDYLTALKQERAQTDAVGAGTPGVNTAIKGAGAALSGVGALRAGLSAGGAAMDAGLPFVMRALGFGADAALGGGAQAAGNLDSVSKPGPDGQMVESTPSLADYAQAAKDGAIVGGVMGAGLPVAGAALGGAYRATAPFLTKPIDGMSRTATGLLRNAMSPRAATALDSLGPEGMLADAGPSFQGLTQGVAAKGGPASDSVVDALRARQIATPTRLGEDINANLGPAQSPVALEQGLTDQQLSAHPIYRRALDNAPPVDPTNALAEIGGQLNKAPNGSAMRNALLSARKMLMTEKQVPVLTDAGTPVLDTTGQPLTRTVPAPVTDAETLLNSRKALDDAINYGSPEHGLVPGAMGGKSGPLGSVRRALDSSLKDQVPGLAQADETFANATKGKDAVDLGQKALARGQNAVWPQDLNNWMAANPQMQQALLRAGARGSVENAVGTNPNDLSALKGMFGDVADWNRTKAATLFGQQPTDNMLNAIEREQTFANTAGPAISGSRTTPMALASKAIDEAVAPANPTLPKNLTWLGAIAHGGEAVVRKGANTLAGVTGDTTRNQLAQALTSQGPQATGLLQMLLADQMQRGQMGRGIAGAFANPAVPRGLLEVLRKHGSDASQ